MPVKDKTVAMCIVSPSDFFSQNKTIPIVEFSSDPRNLTAVEKYAFLK